jgi:hypothetical protein
VDQEVEPVQHYRQALRMQKATGEKEVVGLKGRDGKKGGMHGRGLFLWRCALMS